MLKYDITILEGFDCYVCDCWWFYLHCSSIMSTTIFVECYIYNYILYMSISIWFHIHVYVCICNITWPKQSTYQSIKQLLVSKLMSSHSDTAATATVQRRHLALAFKVLPFMVKEKVSGRVLHNRCRTEPKKKSGSWWFSDEKFAETTAKKKVGPGPMVQYWFSPGKLNPDLLGLGSKPHHLKENFFSS